MSPETDNAKILSDINGLENKVRDFESEVRLTDISDELERHYHLSSHYHLRVKELREKGYVYQKNMAKEAINLASKWRKLKPELQRQINSEKADLKDALSPIESRMSRLLGYKDKPRSAVNLISSLENQCSILENKIEAVNSSIKGRFTNLANESHHFDLNLLNLEELFVEIDEASFDLQPTECPIQFVKAVFVEGKEDKGDPKGLLFLTDQRLIFEQKQKVAKKKVLFIATKKELVQKTIFEVALGYIGKIEPSKRGLLKNEDHLDIEFSDGTLLETHLHLLGEDAEKWAKNIQDAIDGEYDEDRAVKLDEEVVEKMKEIPTTCPNCSGALTQKITRGMDTITCEYCGTVIRI